ncbi:ATP-dependent DNA ligase [Rhodococcus rhodnii]|uniref:DNA ligase n=2 Tax=Rhodococcus rhodnii TaxID=38312 RepID=R7WND1_9NOCA|nr:ATP-dependent DNA ligase [Rhodococcus rhodnii]EOM76798.1 ATP-dependent DNA ligase [Rhodococcus rhodnii LMG 5362]TXG90028.1 ATP-dependent DNA ligase [Rhodococcus rhodnii]
MTRSGAGVLFADVVATSATVAGTRSRTAKRGALEELLRRLRPDEIAPVVAWLSGELLQGRVGIGWRTLAAAEAPPSESPQITVAELDSALTTLANTTGSGSVAARRDVLGGVLAQCTAPEQRFLVAILGGELRQGALEGVMTDAIAAASERPVEHVRRAFMLSGRLPETAVAALTGGSDALAQLSLVVGRPVRPMLASPAESLPAALGELGERVSVEYKLDGARIQVHRDGDDVAVFTRTLRDITAQVPDLVRVARELPCRSVVLDGETLALTDAGRPRPFQETMSRFGATSTRELLLHPYFFDCLHLDGDVLVDAPLGDRLGALSVAADAHRIPGVIAPASDLAEAHLGDAIAHGHEGVMVKALGSPYAAGRRGRAWQKIKPVHTLDLVVLGAEWGYGRRTGWLSNLHLGARDPDGGAPIMVGKTFKGLTDALLRWQTDEFPRHESGRDEHTVYLRPEIVVEIELDGVQVSSRYPGGVALRFARVLRYRPDKTAVDADTIDAVRALLPGGS